MWRIFICLISIMAMGVRGCESLSVFDYVLLEDKLCVERMLLKKPELIHTRDRLGKKLVHYAVCGKSKDLLELLYLYGTDLNAQDVTGMTPLHVCAMWDRRGACKWLLERGANPTIKDEYGDTPLHTSAVFGSIGVGNMLVKKGLSLNEENKNGKTPIELAREYNNVEWLERVAQIGESR